MKIKLTEKSVPALTPPADKPQAIWWDTELTGFGVVVGKAARTFIAEARVEGAKVRTKIGVAGHVREDGHRWTVVLARQRAKELLGEMAAGLNPNADKHAHRSGPTLRDGVALHAANMRKRGRSQRSIDTLEDEATRHLEKWLDRPMTEMRGVDLAEIHERISTDAGPYVANRVVAHVSAVWNSLDRVHELDGRNPARAVTRNPYVPKRERIADEDLPSWHAKVMTLSPVRRDLRLFALFTGMRDEAARRVRWEHVDLKRGALVVPKPKGGEAKAFTTPLAPGVVKMLTRRRTENAIEFGPHGGDQGWVFPSLSLDQTRVQHVVESKERRDDGDGNRILFLPGMHTLRRTFLSVAAEVGISELDRHVLANHAFGRQSVNATYISQAFDHLAECTASIERALLERIRGRQRRRRE